VRRPVADLRPRGRGINGGAREAAGELDQREQVQEGQTQAGATSIRLITQGAWPRCQ